MRVKTDVARLVDNPSTPSAERSKNSRRSSFADVLKNKQRISPCDKNPSITEKDLVISVGAQHRIAETKPWWSEELIAQLPAIEEMSTSRTLSSEMSAALKIVARDTSYLTITLRENSY